MSINIEKLVVFTNKDNDLLIIDNENFVVRFSSIGDIVLTTPILRCIKQQLNDVEFHFITKHNFISY